MYEVEQKFRVGDHQAIEAQLTSWGAQWRAPVEQLDRYFGHPVRDFGETDEAFRVRQIGERTVITYKGPKIDAETKTRAEIEIPLADGPGRSDAMKSLVEALGFRPVGEVRKQRRAAHLTWQETPFEIALDTVAELGAFVELETQADEAGLPAARQQMLSLAAALELQTVERRSYLELILEQLDT